MIVELDVSGLQIPFGNGLGWGLLRFLYTNMNLHLALKGRNIQIDWHRHSYIEKCNLRISTIYKTGKSEVLTKKVLLNLFLN